MALRFEEGLLLDKLGTLPPLFRTAFATSAATRLVPAFSSPVPGPGRFAEPTLARILEEIWRDLQLPPLAEIKFRSLLDRCMSLLPDEADEWSAARPYAEDAVSAVAYALRSGLTGSTQEAVWAARRVYEALDQHVITVTGVSLGAPDAEDRLVADPRVQTELQHQQNDLMDLLAARHSEDPKVLQILQQRANSAMYYFLAPEGA